METSPPGSFKWIDSPSENAWAWKDRADSVTLLYLDFFEMRGIGNDPLRFNAHVLLCNRDDRLVAPMPVVACAGAYVQWSQTPWRECCFISGENSSNCLSLCK